VVQIKKAKAERVFKSKKCRVKSCRKLFKPWNSFQVVCNSHCALLLIRQKAAESYKKETNRLTKKFLDTDKKHWKNKARVKCHQYIRLRDYEKPCISCNKFHVGQFSAGHFQTRAAKSELQFHEWNIQKECSQCNQFANPQDRKYRFNLINRIGRKNVEFLELSHIHYSWTVDDYKGVFWWYSAKIEALGCP